MKSPSMSGLLLAQGNMFLRAPDTAPEPCTTFSGENNG